MRIPVIGLGAGGHARVLIETLRFNQEYDLVGLLDCDPDLQTKDIMGIPVLGSDNLLPLLAKDVKHFFVGLGSTSWPTHRVELFRLATSYGMLPIQIIHPSAIISPSTTLGAGSMVLCGAIINTFARLGTNVIVNSGAIVEHDSVIGDHVHIATGAHLCGTVTVEKETHIGAGATILQNVKVGANSIVGAGSVVIRDTPDDVTVVGVPARIIKSGRG